MSVCDKHRHVPPLSELTERLRRKALKVTAPRQAVLDLLRQQPHPASIKEMHAALTESNCDLATIYRCMHLLERAGIAKRYDLGDGVARFELVPEGEDGHHHHLVCVSCSGVVEIEGCPMREQEEQIAARNGFRSVTHKLEFFGVCPSCQSNQTQED